MSAAIKQTAAAHPTWSPRQVFYHLVSQGHLSYTAAALATVQATLASGRNS